MFMFAVYAALVGLLLPYPAMAQGDVSDNAPGVFASDERLLTTYFFFRGPWDDVERSGPGAPWQFTYPSPDDPRAAIFGLDSAENWPGGELPDYESWPVDYHNAEQFPLWLMAEWRAMKWSGFDFVLVDVWNSLCFSADGSARFPFDALAEAWLELDRRGEDPLPMALFLETPFAHFPSDKDWDATQASEDGIREIWEPTWAFLRQFYGEGDNSGLLPRRAVARIDVGGEARPVIQYWFPTWVGAGLKKWNEWTFSELRDKCRETFGVEPYIGVSQHVHGRKFVGGWNGKQPDDGRADISYEAGVVDYDVAWWGAMAGPQIYPNAIAIGPGHWCPRQTGDKPMARRYDPEAYAPDDYRYTYCWRKVLSNPDHFDRKLLIVESWNNGGEACVISYCEPKDHRTEDGTLIDRWGDRPEKYMALTRELAPYWKHGQCPERFEAE